MSYINQIDCCKIIDSSYLTIINMTIIIYIIFLYLLGCVWISTSVRVYNSSTLLHL